MRKNPQIPTAADGYNWTLYRVEYSGGQWETNHIPITLDNLSIPNTERVDFNQDGLSDVLGVRHKTLSDETCDSGTQTLACNIPRPALIEGYRMSFGGSGGRQPTPDMLQSVQNGLGKMDSFSYEPLTYTDVYARTGTNPASYPDMRFSSPMQVVASAGESNPVGGTNTTAYFYQDAEYNVKGRGFLGFRTIQATNEASGTTTITTYRQTFPYIGRVSSTKTFKTGDSTPFAASATVWADIPSSTTNGTRYVVKAASSEQVQTDPKSTVAPQATTSTTGNFTLISESTSTQAVNPSNVDACGNVKQSETTTTTQQATQSADTNTSYNGGNADACWLDTVHQQFASANVSYSAVSNNETPVTSASVAATTTYGYSSNNYWQVTSKKIVSTHNGTAERLTAYGYDGFGNRISVTQEDPSGKLPDRTTTSNYGTDGYFPLVVTNALGQKTHFTYDAATGNKTSAIDPNGIETDYAFDAFGRKLGGRKPGASAVVLEYEAAGASDVNCPSVAARDTAYAIRQTQQGYPTSYSCYDAYGNALRSVTQDFSGAWIHQDNAYDALGRMIWSTQPRDAGASTYYTHYESYDVLGRVGTKVIPTYGGGTRTIAMAYTGLKIKYTDSSGGVTHVYTHYYDGLGKGNGHLVQVDQQSDNGTYTATYRYDAGGNLIRATDPAGNAITATYDGFGDKLTLDDPDKGKWRYTYDGFGEQASETNAASQTISTAYDKLGRPTQVNDQADDRVVITQYDPVPDGVGQPAVEKVENWKQTATSYIRRYGYDTAGRASVTEITTGGKTYLQGMHYDADGRPDQQAYPGLSGSSNEPPSVTASANPSGTVAPNKTVTLTAKGSDPNGSWQLSYHWAQDSKDTIQVPISQADTDQASVTLSPSTTTTAYHFTVTASDGLSTATDTVTLTAEPAPTATVNPTVTPSTSETGSFTVSWGTVSHATDYLLEQSKDGGSWTTAYNGSGTSKVLSGRGAGTYRYRVRGENAVGQAAWGGTATETVVAPPPPSAPLLSPNPSPNGAYTVQWGSVSKADTYKLDESVDSAAWNVIQNASALNIAISDKANGDSVRYRVAACNATTGCGGWSAIATESVEYVPATPANFHQVTPPILVPPGNAYNLAWDSTAYATSYELALNGTTGTQTGITGTSETETAPNRYDATDGWRIRACSAGGCSAWSASITVSTQPSSGGGGTCTNPPCINPKIAAAPKAAGGSGSPSSQLVVATAYSTTGYPETLTRASDGSVYAQVATMNAFGQATRVFEGGTSQSTAAVTLNRGYDPATGLVTSIAATNAANTALATVTSAWDGFGNLTTRTESTADMTGTSTETATYDKINRLTGSSTSLNGGVGGTTSESYGYDKTGNRTEWDSTDTAGQVTRRSYTYGFGNGTLPHAVSALNGDSSLYAYNQNGEMTTDAGRTLGWTPFGKASSITQGSTTVTFAYGPGDSRYQKVVTGPSPETVTYLGGAERLDINGNLSIRRTLSLAGVTIIDTGGAQSKRLYPVMDHLGSTIAVVDSTGSLLQGLSYGDFGRRYTTQWNSLLSTGQAVNIDQNQTDKGYTGQESLDTVGLDDYNARLYDPGLGRFLSTDPLISNPDSTQSINPYSYVVNNPLNKTDPTGEHVGGCTDATQVCQGNGSNASSWFGPNEVKDMVGKALKNNLISSSQGKALDSKFGHGISANSSFLHDLSNTIGALHIDNVVAYSSKFNSNTHSQSAGGAPTLAPASASEDNNGGGNGGGLLTTAVSDVSRFYNWTTAQGDYAARYWATKQDETGNWLYAIPGVFATLWTPKAAPQTALTLIPADGVGAYVGRSFWRYVGPVSDEAGKWLTRGLGWGAPYGRDFEAAKDALQLPRMPTDVIRARPKWYKPIAGPRPVWRNPQFGKGGGWEYYKDWRFPPGGG